MGQNRLIKPKMGIIRVSHKKRKYVSLAKSITLAKGAPCESISVDWQTEPRDKLKENIFKLCISKFY